MTTMIWFRLSTEPDIVARRGEGIREEGKQTVTDKYNRAERRQDKETREREKNKNSTYRIRNWCCSP